MSIQIDLTNVPKDNPLLVSSFDRLIQNIREDKLKVTEQDLINAGFTPEEFYELIALGLRIDGLDSWTEKPLSFLDEEVPVEFEQSSITEMGENGTPTIRQKTWREYCLYRTNATNCLLKAGYVDSNGNRQDVLSFEELMTFVQYFGAENCYSINFAQDLINLNYNRE